MIINANFGDLASNPAHLKFLTRKFDSGVTIHFGYETSNAVDHVLRQGPSVACLQIESDVVIDKSGVKDILSVANRMREWNLVGTAQVLNSFQIGNAAYEKYLSNFVTDLCGALDQLGTPAKTGGAFLCSIFISHSFPIVQSAGLHDSLNSGDESFRNKRFRRVWNFGSTSFYGNSADLCFVNGYTIYEMVAINTKSRPAEEMVEFFKILWIKTRGSLINAISDIYLGILDRSVSYAPRKLTAIKPRDLALINSSSGAINKIRADDGKIFECFDTENGRVSRFNHFAPNYISNLNYFGDMTFCIRKNSWSEDQDLMSLGVIASSDDNLNSIFVRDIKSFMEEEGFDFQIFYSMTSSWRSSRGVPPIYYLKLGAIDKKVLKKSGRIEYASGYRIIGGSAVKNFIDERAYISRFKHAIAATAADFRDNYSFYRIT